MIMGPQRPFMFAQGAFARIRSKELYRRRTWLSQCYRLKSAQRALFYFLSVSAAVSAILSDQANIAFRFSGAAYRSSVQNQLMAEYIPLFFRKELH